MSGIAGSDRSPRLFEVGRAGAPARLVVSLVAIVVMTACSGGDDPAADTTTVAPPTTPVSTIATTTTVPPTNVPPTTAPSTSAPPTTAPTTAPPSSPTESEASEETRRLLVDLAQRSWTLFNEAKLDPTNDAKVAAIADVRMGASVDFVIEVLGQYRNENWRSVTNPAVPASITPYPETIRLDPSGGTAVMQFCQVNSNIVVEVGANPDGTDAVVGDGVLIEFGELTFTLVEGTWLESGVVQIDRQPGVTVCPATAG